MAVGFWVLAAPVRADIYVFRDHNGVMHFSDERRHYGYQPYLGERSSTRPVSTRVHKPSVPASPAAYDGVIRWASRSHDVPPALVKAVVHAESLFDPKAVSKKGAQGLMQLMPETAMELGVDDPFNPWQNIEGGTRYLSTLIQRFRGDLRLGLAAYNAGEKAVRRYSGVPPYRETQAYVTRVLSLYHRYDANLR